MAWLADAITGFILLDFMGLFVLLIATNLGVLSKPTGNV